MAGDAGAFALLMRNHDERLRRLAAGILTDAHRIDDTMQEAYIKAWQQLPRFRKEADLGPGSTGLPTTRAWTSSAGTGVVRLQCRRGRRRGPHR